MWINEIKPFVAMLIIYSTVLWQTFSTFSIKYFFKNCKLLVTDTLLIVLYLGQTCCSRCIQNIKWMVWGNRDTFWTLCFCKLFFPVKITTFGKRNVSLPVEKQENCQKKTTWNKWNSFKKTCTTQKFYIILFNFL